MRKTSLEVKPLETNSSVTRSSAAKSSTTKSSATKSSTTKFSTAQAKSEIKAIEAELQSIRANSDSSHRVPPAVLASVPSPRTSNPNVASSPAPAFPSTSVHSTSPSAQRSPSAAPRPATSSFTPRYSSSPSHSTHPQLSATVERLQQQSSFYIRQFQRLQAHPPQTAEQYLTQALRMLEAQAQHINQLSAVQETAILEWKAIAEKVQQDWEELGRPSRNPFEPPDPNDLIDVPTLCEYLKPHVPQVEKNHNGVYVLTSRSIDLFKAEREAALTAQALRRWAERKSAQPSRTESRQGLWQWLIDKVLPPETEPSPPDPVSPVAPSSVGSTRSPAPAAPPSNHPRPSAPAAAQPARRRSRSRRLISLQQGVALLLGAVIARLVLDLTLSTLPILWAPAVALFVTPAAIAVYRSSRTPQSGFVWGYRLLIIMIGLLVGGRL